MDVSGLLRIVEGLPEVERLVEALSEQRAGLRPAPAQNVARAGVRVVALDGAAPAVLAALRQRLQVPVLVVVPRPKQSQRLVEQLQAWAGPAATVLHYPEPDGLPYERMIVDALPVLQRLRALRRLLHGDGPPIVVASVIAAAHKTLPQQELDSAWLRLKVGTRMPITGLLAHLTRLGYVLENAVEVPGTVSRRGGIVDLYPATASAPVRVEFGGDRIESLRLFDASTQRSIGPATSVDVGPVRELLFPQTGTVRLDDLTRNLDLSNVSPGARETLMNELAAIVEGRADTGQEFYAPLFPRDSVLDYLHPNGLLVLVDPAQMEQSLREMQERGEELRRSQAGRGELPRDFPSPLFTWQALDAKVKERQRLLTLDPWGFDASTLLHETQGEQISEMFRMPFEPAPSSGGRLTELLDSIKPMLERKETVVMVTQQAERLSELLMERDVPAAPASALAAPPAPGSLTLLHGALEQGWVVALGQRGDRNGNWALTVLTDAELFGVAKRRKPVTRRPIRREEFLAELKPGDYVVHVDHGIGRFVGMVHRPATSSRPAEGGIGEYLLLEYAASGRLYVPVEQVDRIGPYVAPGGQPPALSKLGSVEWQRTKQRVKESAREMARELLDLYAARQTLPGHAFGPDTQWQHELEASFPYIETEDQAQAIAEVKGDMEQPRPMDRLVCGDVGYGKTEVALRAAFKAVADGYQAAVLVPTTILAQQHEQTFQERLAPFPVKVAMLSRFLSPAEQKQVADDLAKGRVDIVIGTHRLLGKDVRFKNLGLVVIDEEQRFGVAHKERLKQMRKEVDVLALSATPIPRTLYMALSGARDMSTLATPPEERYPISTYVGPYDEQVVREAIVREVERGGQVFFVHNRVQNIEAVAERVRRLAPEAKVIVGHGQMPEEELERVMAEFGGGNAQVLVSTTIIESGLDIPNVNTLIVNEANRLGLSQLYQLRGRVGRGAMRAYAYFFFDRHAGLTEQAEKRLKTILTATELGSGFKIAMKDLEIRGAGNLLGAEQSGHISAVGFDLYCRLLEQAVEEMKAFQEGRPLPRPDEGTGPAIDLPLSANLPEDYIPDTTMRLRLYQRLVLLREPQESDTLDEELQDRFGPLPLAARNLLYVVRVRALARKAGVTAVQTDGSQVVVRSAEASALATRKYRLQERLGRDAQVGVTTLRFPMRQGKWQRALLEALETMRE